MLYATLSLPVFRSAALIGRAWIVIDFRPLSKTCICH
jgi:hypothetical protein